MRTLNEDYKLNIAILERAKYNSIIEEIERLETVFPRYHIRDFDNSFNEVIFEGVEPTALYRYKADVLDMRIRKVHSYIQRSIDELTRLKNQAISKRDRQQHIINELGGK